MTGERIPRAASPPHALAYIPTAERLAIIEGTGALGRELTRDEAKVAIACAQLFCGQIIDLEHQVAALAGKLMDLFREQAG